MNSIARIAASLLTVCLLLVLIDTSLKDVVVKHIEFSSSFQFIPSIISGLQQFAIIACYGLLLFLLTRQVKQSLILVSVLCMLLLSGVIYGSVTGNWSIISHLIHRPYIFFLFLLSHFAQRQLGKSN